MGLPRHLFRAKPGAAVESPYGESSPRRRARRQTVAVVVVCHPAYHGYLADAVASIEGQGFEQKILAYDLAGQPSMPAVDLPSGWTIQVGSWSSPSPARNAALAQCKGDWVCFWDADNIMPPGYLADASRVLRSAEKSVGVCYPDVQQVRPDGTLGSKRFMPPWSFFGAMGNNLCDTASFWRVQAVDQVGGFPLSLTRYDDYELALRLFQAGWKGQKLPTVLPHLDHPDNRSSTSEHLGNMFGTWSFAFVTLWSGEKQSAQVLDWLASAEIPPKSSLYWVDNSGGGAHTSMLLADYQRRLATRFTGGLTFREVGRPYEPAPGEDYLHVGRHDHVSRLYNTVLPKIREEVVVFLEDDVVPPADGVRRLLSLLNPGSRVASVAGVYRSRRTPTLACAARRKDRWGDVPKWDDLPSKPFEVGMTGGGFTMVGNWALSQCLPMRCDEDEFGQLSGWDCNLGKSLTALGYSILAHPGVRCAHVCPEVLAFERSQKTTPNPTPSESLS